MDRLVGYIEKEKRDTLLQEIAEVEKPGYIYGDNEACIFCVFFKTKKVSNRTKRIDIREHFIIIERG